MKQNLLITFAILTFLISCKKSGSSDAETGHFLATASFTIDGDNFNEQIIKIQGAAKTTTRCTYSATDKITTLTINDQPDINTDMKNQFFLVFNGNTPATQHAGDDPNGGSFNSIYFQISVTDKAGVLHPYLFENTNNTPGVFTITKYGGVGENVEGKFSGILVDEDGNPAIKIYNGSFSITRGKDIN
jgi:hypothetical protein